MQPSWRRRFLTWQVNRASRLILVVRIQQNYTLKEPFKMTRKGPFGLYMGMSLNDLTAAGCGTKPVAPGKYLVDNVPKPHSLFEKYAVQIGPQSGLSWIKAIGKTIPTSVFGMELKSAFDSLETKLASTYGRFDRTDLLLPDSIWNEPRDWMQGLLNRERYLMSAWSKDKRSTLTDSLTSVAVACTAIDTDSGYLSVEYTFENEPAAEAEISRAEDDAL
jgi:hypothetical protein